jgi:hypothetical protein
MGETGMTRMTMTATVDITSHHMPSSQMAPFCPSVTTVWRKTMATGTVIRNYEWI